MYLTKDIDIEVDINLSVKEIFMNLAQNEKDDLLELIVQGRSGKNYYLENLFIGRCDKDILTNLKIWDKIIRLIKYEDSTLKDYIIEELSYEPLKN